MANSWNSLRLRKIGRSYAEQAYDLADNLNSYGADATFLLLDEKAQRRRLAKRSPDITIPTMFADVLMAVLLALPRPKQTGRRRGWSPVNVQARVETGLSLRAAALEEALATGVSRKTIERAMRATRAKTKAKRRKK